MGALLEEYKKRWEALELEIVNFKKQNKSISQRKISKKFDVSVGFVNKTLKKLYI